MAYKGEKGTYRGRLNVIEGCVKCSLSNFRERIVTYRGTPYSDVMVVGEAPGYTEQKEGLPMVGKTGSYLVSILHSNGLLLSKHYYITNSCLCKPLENADPTVEQMNACSEWLNYQIDLVQPRLIIAAGRLASSRLIPEWSSKYRITKEEGNIYTPPHLRGCNVVPVRHPSAILRNPSSKSEYEENIKDICDKIKSEEILGNPSYVKSPYEYDNNEESLF